MGFAARDRAEREQAIRLATACRARGLSAAELTWPERFDLCKELGERPANEHIWHLVVGMLTVELPDDPFEGLEHGVPRRPR